MPETPTLSLCLIAKNEESHLPRCLDSVRGLADEIVLVDTGSTDRTIEIARSFGARVFEVAWQDDFSLARNASIERATGEWILVLDADESIAARDHATIRALTRQRDADAVTSVQRHYLGSGTVVGWRPGPGGYDEGAPYPGYMDVECRRLFQNRPWLRFRKRVHEELQSIDPARPLVQVRADWVIHHYGKADSQERLREKGEAYLRIGLQKIHDRPADPLAHYELGIQYRELERPREARACFEKALGLVPNFRDSVLQIAICHMRLGESDEALAALKRAARTLPQHAAEIALEEGNLRQQQGDLAAAERAFSRAVGTNPGLAAASVNLALLLRASGRLPEARACLDEAISRCPGHADLLALRAQTRRDLHDDDGALADLDLLGSRANAPRLRARILAQQRRFADARDCLDSTVGPPDAELLGLRGAVALGLGEVGDAIVHLRRSLAMETTFEAALNLSTALEAHGNRAGGLQAVAEALRVCPDDAAALDRFGRLAGTAFRHRAAASDSGPLTIFFYQPHSIPFDARTPRAQGLGGTESAIVYLAEALGRLGHHVVVFNGCEEAGTFDGVEYARWEAMPARVVADRPDVLVAIRAWRTIGCTRFAPLQIFWTGDAFDQPFLDGLSDPGLRAEIDFFMLQSAWQEESFRVRHGVPGWRIARTRLGTAASAARAASPSPGRTPRARRLAYTSTPFRGLDVLLQVFPRIRAACPDAELDVFSSMRVYGVPDAEDRAQNGALYRKARQAGVNLVGSLPQPVLAERLLSARVLAYPNHFPETFCIAAAEAQAAGCAIVTSDLGAMPETVGDAGICLPGDPRSTTYRDAFVKACVSLLTEDERWHAMSQRAMERGWSLFAWPAIAREWAGLFRSALPAQSPALERAAKHLAAGRAGLASRMLERESPPPGLPDGIWDRLRELAAWRAGAAAPPIETLRQIAIHVPSLRRADLLEAPGKS